VAGPPPDWTALAEAIAKAIVEAERSPELLSVEESLAAAKLYDLDKGVQAQDGQKYRFDCRDIVVRTDVDVTVELNLDKNSTFTVQADVPYTCSALRRIRQVKVTPSAAAALKLQFAGINLGKV